MLRTWLWAPLLLAACKPSGSSVPSAGEIVPGGSTEAGGSFHVPLDQVLGPVQKATRPLPPISGGTLAVGERQGHPVAVASDPEHDRIWLVESTTSLTSRRLDLPDGSEPGRVAIAGGRAFVALRRSGEVAVVDLEAGKITSRVGVCAAPRGLAVDVATDTLAVACASGELLLRQGSTMATVASYNLGTDLRDVVLQGDEILVTRFRSAELLVLRRQDGTPIEQGAPDDGSFDQKGRQTPASVAWRMVPGVDGHPVVLHQRHVTSEISTTQPGGYGSSVCDAVVQTALSEVGGGAIRSTGGLSTGLAVDVAVRSDGAVVMAVPDTGVSSSLTGLPTVTNGPSGDDGDDGSGAAGFGTGFGTGGLGAGASAGSAGSTSVEGGVQGFTGDPVGLCGSSTTRAFGFGGDQAPGEARAELEAPSVVSAVAVAFDGNDQLVAQTRAPQGLWWGGRFLGFGDDLETTDTGHQIFHMDSGSGLACASCHPEGGEDGRVWNFETIGPRRTQALQGGLRGSEPFHWNGDVATIGDLMSTVFTGRMGGGLASPAQADALLGWLDQMRLVPTPTPVDAAAVTRGQALYESTDVGCIDCHQGPRLALPQSFDVGTGATLQVPSLRGVVYRAPFLHDGRAATLLDRFGPGGGGDQHGQTSQLSTDQVSDLIAYLSSL